MQRRLRSVVLCIALAFPALAQQQLEWRDTYESRLEILALLQSLMPGRLTPAMNALLETTGTPFGNAVQPLRPYRRTVAVTMLWTPLPRGWEQQKRPRSRWCGRRMLAIPKDVFQHRAVLYTAEHLPFSEVVETYQAGVFAFRHEDGVSRFTQIE